MVNAVGNLSKLSFSYLNPLNKAKMLKAIR